MDKNNPDKSAVDEFDLLLTEEGKEKLPTG